MTEAVDALIKANADVNASLKSYTPVYFATIGNNLEIVKALVAAGATIDQGQEDREKILYFANPRGDEKLRPLFDFLVSKKAKALGNEYNYLFREENDFINLAALFFDDATLLNSLAKSLEDLKAEDRADIIKKALKQALAVSHFSNAEFLLKMVDAKDQAKVKNELLGEMSGKISQKR